LDVVAGIDSDPACGYPYHTNIGAKFIEKDIRAVTGKEILALYPKGYIKVLVGCAPCQPFSALSNRKGVKKDTDEKWNLLKEFSRLIRGVKPDVVSMENVPALARNQPFQDFLSVLEDLNYNYSTIIAKCEEFGVPQRRRRLVLLASRRTQAGCLKKTHQESVFVTVRNAIGDLAPLSAGEMSKTDTLHSCQGLSTKNLLRIRSSRPGGSWKDWPESLRLNCHKNAKGESYTPVYGRMSWNEPSPTITTRFYNYGSGRFGHPDQDRPISLREGALLQSFPLDYRFTEPGKIPRNETVARLIGNAVPVELGKAIGMAIISETEGGIW